MARMHSGDADVRLDLLRLIPRIEPDQRTAAFVTYTIQVGLNELPEQQDTASDSEALHKLSEGFQQHLAGAEHPSELQQRVAGDIAKLVMWMDMPDLPLS